MAGRVYELIEHIENSVFADEKYTSNAAADRAKVLRATRMLPKLVLHVENFNKFVLQLSQKTKHDLADYLHMGTVRDFKISKSAFRAVINQSAVDDDETYADQADGDVEWRDSEEEVEALWFDDMTTTSAADTTNVDRQSPATITADVTASGRLLELNDVDVTRPERALKNLALMNARLKRKRMEEVTPGEDETNEENYPHAPQKRERRC